MILVTWAVLSGCVPDETEPEPDLTFPWLEKTRVYANCTLDAEIYGTAGGRGHASDIHVEYDDNGLYTLYEYYDIWYADGDITERRTRDLDEYGRLQTAVYSYGAGVPEEDRVVTYTYEGAVLVSSEAESPSGRYVPIRYVHTTDAFGREISREGDEFPFDEDMDDAVLTHEYDDDETRGVGSYKSDWLGDSEEESDYGDPTYSYAYTYDEDGNRLTVEYEAFGEYAWSGRGEYTYRDGREDYYDGVCDAPCWKWDRTQVYFDWECPS